MIGTLDTENCNWKTTIDGERGVISKVRPGAI